MLKRVIIKFSDSISIDSKRIFYMKYIEMPDGSPAYHLAFEQAVAESITGDALILWQNSPALVCGSYQNVFREADVYAAYKSGVPVVRRISGGGTVYHDKGNLNYTLVTDFNPEYDYSDVMKGMITALQKMGIPAEKGSICDISVCGKKVSGNAQRVFNGRLMHHGTLLFSTDLSALKLLCGRSGREYTDKSIKSVPAEVLNLREFFPGSILDFKKGIIACFPSPLEPYSPAQDVYEKADELNKTRYASDEWTYLKNPTFSVSAEKEYGFARYRAEKGIIKEGKIVFKGKELTDKFLGARLIPSETEALCKELSDDYELLAGLIL